MFKEFFLDQKGSRLLYLDMLHTARQAEKVLEEGTEPFTEERIFAILARSPMLFFRFLEWNPSGKGRKGFELSEFLLVHLPTSRLRSLARPLADKSGIDLHPDFLSDFFSEFIPVHLPQYFLSRSEEKGISGRYPERQYAALIEEAISGAEDKGGRMADRNGQKLAAQTLRVLARELVVPVREDFFSYVVYEALRDGVLSAEETEMLRSIASAIELPEEEVGVILNRNALLIQRTYVSEAMARLFELAQANGEVVVDEKALLLKLKRKFDARLIADLAAVVTVSPGSDIRLKISDEDLFGEMLHLSMSDNEVQGEELEVLKRFALSRNMDLGRVKELIQLAKAG
ncbi:MAG: hypothetical protein HQL31_13865 [Planctomycetes bacterium]|nr:hypothetical protein [Planctomycetota bacterium]